MAKILTLTLNPALDITISLERLRPGAVNRSQAQHSHAAGKGLNVAQVLADLGHCVTVGGFLGLDNLAPFEALIAWRGFADCFVRVPGETRSNIKLVEADGQVTDINGPGPQVDEAARDALLQRLAEVAPGHDAVVVAGSLPRGISPEWLRELLLMLKSHGLKVALDSSGEALRAGLEAAPWLVKPNTEELGEVLGQPVLDPAGRRAAAQRLLASGVEHVVVSQGEQGVTWFATGLALHAQPSKVHIASTVGAGDSLVAGMVHGLLQAEAPAATLRRATAIAAQAVTQVGFGIQDREQLARLEAAVHLAEQQEEGC
ncbi:1-phosphofructokinase [Pseudomonas mosselii]|uniref:1-phosphofructokinase n=1 Tax=Pseudomonas mosselii TaxID=78327 RepID=UPI0021A59448|nr:1-phosphofructokinase [Pseudomonas mosselii]MDH1657341.1 1-phosphofructokinase [Pseudomonas mosselii]MDH1717794.1 1-phosphofructokinase [Pseudomonas mosselii]MDH1723054.1 1-phosphofructokinase [Pseudomonas mosselii]MEA3236824.1 1-phosphofructokinase [Pseudomonas mosselii]UWS68100.1 1-phosphofructokinase [Pseudomonas mosselii]